MAGFSIQNYGAIGLLCLLGAFSFPGVAEAGYTMNETCLYLQKGYIGDPTNCQNWGYCSGGSLIQTGTCNSGLLYDSATGVCDYASKVTCQSSTQNICNNLNEAQYIADPNNCNAYCYCNNKQIQNFNCPQYQVFDPNTVKCTWNTGSNCAANSICRLVQNNQFVGDPSNCGGYVRCYNGAGVSGNCAAGSSFNPMLGGCEAGTFDCGSNPGGTPSPAAPIPPTNPTICKGYKTGGAATQYFADSATCYGFYSCASATATGQWGACPFATHFNPNTQQCVTPYTFACTYNRCGNIQEGFMTVPGNKCSQYTVCVNQVNTTVASCADFSPDYPYFDEYYGACVANPVNYPVCS